VPAEASGALCKLCAVTGSGAWAKWERAKGHLETLRTALGVTAESPYGWTKRYRATPERRRGGLEYRFYVDAVELDTEDWALMAGDCLFNLRSALDHLVFDLHLKRFRGHVPEAIAEKTAFPILTDRPTGRRGRSSDPAKWREIKHLGFKQRRAIAWLQPYNRRNDKFREIRHAIGEIATLNNVDKHRHLHVLQATPLMTAVAWFGDPPAHGFRQDSFFDMPLVSKTEVFRWTFETVPPDIGRYLGSGGHVSAFICLHEGGKASLLWPYLREMTASVEAVLRRFGPFLR
jgi:hypothetical protein